MHLADEQEVIQLLLQEAIHCLVVGQLRLVGVQVTLKVFFHQPGLVQGQVSVVEDGSGVLEGSVSLLDPLLSMAQPRGKGVQGRVRAGLGTDWTRDDIVTPMVVVGFCNDRFSVKDSWDRGTCLAVQAAGKQTLPFSPHPTSITRLLDLVDLSHSVSVNVHDACGRALVQRALCN